ncbi:unnamed protein product [Effrenium voratum]|nr:unnamed protein product [Effrenium voratum]
MEHVDGIPAAEHSEGPEQRDRANSHVTSIAETDDPDDSELELPVGREASIETVDQYFPGNFEEGGEGNLTSRSDRFAMLSVARDASELDTLPLLLVIFVCLVAALLGMVVAGLHSMIKYVGCPLGVNGCNSFSGADYEKKGFILIKALEDYMPEDLVYVLMAMVSLFLIGAIVEAVPESYGKQVLGGGTVQSLLAVAAGIPISFRCAVLRVLITAIYFTGGGTMGGDGPTIQVCTGLAGMIGWIFGSRAPRTQSLLASLGFCCGFAASFNAPLSGILFAMEELQHVSSRLTTRVICIILLGSIVSTAVMRGFLENKVLFSVSLPPNLEEMVSGGSADRIFGKQMWMLISVAIGLLCALVGYAFHKSFHFIHWLLDKYCARIPRYLVFAMLAGLSAAIGSAVFRITGLRGVWGIGVQSLQEALTENPDLQASHALIFAFGKLCAFALGVSARFPGDTLEPVLISGGFLGAFVGRLLPAELTGGSGGSLCEIFGMVGLFASCFRFPLTPVVIVLEITGTESYNLILPVALSSFTALAVSNHLFPPLLEQLLEQDGIDLEAVAELAETADDEEFSQKASVELSDSQREEEDRPKRVDSVASVLHSATQTALGKLEMHLERSMLEVSSVDHTRRISLSSSRSPSSRRQSLGASFASAKNGLRRLSLRSESSTPRPGGLGDEMVGPCFASFGDSEDDL